jgi:cyclin B
MPTKGYMKKAAKKETSDGKKLVNHKMRAIVVDWMIELHQRFRPSLQPAALYLAINIFDRFLASGHMKECYRLQVVGAACLLVAAKIEEIYPPKVRELKKMVDGATAPEICTAERAILKALKFQVSVPTVFHFMKRYLKAAEADLQLKALTMFIVEVALHDVEMVEEKPSLLVSSAIHLGLKMLKRTPWSPTLQAETKYGPDDFQACESHLVPLLKVVPSEDTLYAVSTKFSSSKYLEVAKIPVTPVVHV